MVLKVKKYKNELYIFILLSLTAFAWQLLNIIVKIYFLEYLAEVIYIQGIIIFGSFLFSLGFGTYIRFLVYDKKVDDIRMTFNIVYLITVILFTISIINIGCLYFFKFGYQTISLFFLAGLLSLFSLYMSFSLAIRNLYLLSMYTFIYIFYISILFLIAIYLKETFFMTVHLSFIYSLLSLSGIVILVLNFHHVANGYTKKKQFRLIKKAFVYFYLAIPIRLLIFIISLMIAKVSRIDTSIAEIFVYSQIGTSIIKFFISRIFLLLEKNFFQQKQLPVYLLISIFFIFSMIIYFIISVLMQNYDINIFLIIILLLNIVLYGYVRQFQSAEQNYKDSTYFLVFLVLFFVIMFISTKVFLAQNIVYALLVLNIFVLFFMLVGGVENDFKSKN